MATRFLPTTTCQQTDRTGAPSKETYPELDLPKLIKHPVVQRELLPDDFSPVFEGDCGCPDWSEPLNGSGKKRRFHSAQPRGPREPCKHLAALVCKVAAMVDHDPSILFAMRGVHLWEAAQSAPPPPQPATRPGSSKAEPLIVD